MSHAGRLLVATPLIADPTFERTVVLLLAHGPDGAFGVVLNRFNVSLTAYAGYRDFTYFPSLVEIAVTLGLLALAIVAFDFGARVLPVYHHDGGGALGHGSGT